MNSNVILFGWNRSIPGRESISAEHFQEFVQYLDGLKKSSSIQGYDVVFLNAHGGDLNGFFLIRGETRKLFDLMSTADWAKHMLRASLHLQGSGSILGATGDAVMERMKIWTSLLPT
jgi:hypothetical protein